MRTRLPFATVASGVLLAGLAGVVALEMRGAPGPAWTPRNPATPNPVEIAAGGNGGVSAQQIARRVGIILVRPLFNPDRRPDATLGDGGDTGLARLTGVLVGPFGRTAIFAGAGSKAVVVEQGGRIGAYVVSSIGLEGVTVTGPDGSRVLHPTFEPVARSGPPHPALQAVRATAPK